MSGSGHSPRHSQAPMPIAEEGPEELRRRMSQLSNSDIEKVANVALGEVTRRNSNRYAIDDARSGNVDIYAEESKNRLRELRRAT